MSYDYARGKVASEPMVSKMLLEALETWLYTVQDLVQKYSSPGASIRMKGTEMTCWMPDIDEAEARENGDILFGRGSYRVEAHRLKPGMWVLTGQVDVAGVLKRSKVPG